MKNFRDAALAASVPIALVAGFLCLVVWWMQTNFGAISALATVGGVVMATVLYAGVRIGGGLVRDAQRTALENFTDGLAAVEESRTATARGQNAVQVAQAKIAVIDYQHQLRQQQQRQRLLMDSQQTVQPAATWAMDNVNANVDVCYHD